MEKLLIDLENCYGIRKLTCNLDFSNQRTVVIYAQNGIMKSSLASTFKDIQQGKETQDRFFPERKSKRIIQDQLNVPISSEIIEVFPPIDEQFSTYEKVSTLLVNSDLRKEYEEIFLEINQVKDHFLELLKDASKSKRDFEVEISQVFDNNPESFFQVLIKLRPKIEEFSVEGLNSIEYDQLFNDKLVSFLQNDETRLALDEYIKKYNQLLEESKFFKKGVFDYYNASTVAKNLSTNGFFKAHHTILLKSDTNMEIENKSQLDELIEDEKKAILLDSDLQAKYKKIEDLITKNADSRSFEKYLSEHEEVLPYLVDLEELKKMILIAYIQKFQDSYIELIEKYIKAEDKRKQIEKAASDQKTQWEEVIEIFNDRFFVPFKLVAKNRESVILGKNNFLSVEFVFQDGAEEKLVKKDDLIQALSTGEKKALYILNILFEVETRKKDHKETLLIFDDIADSFDYKNKYAILQYLQDNTECSYFSQIILTHNFDFFRTLNSRFVPYNCCFMVYKDSTSIHLEQAVGIRNIFINDWKLHFFECPKKKIASIPFIRNLIEYTKGETDEYQVLTSLLHWKNNSDQILVSNLDQIFNETFGQNGVSNSDGKVIDQIFILAQQSLSQAMGINLEEKIILSIAIRLAAEKFMINKINDANFVSEITKKQTYALFKKYRDNNSSKTKEIRILQNVQLMTSENLHLNSFMYEPIIDMSEEHLKKLYTDVIDLH